ncbi:MAG: FAD-dependent oxidoreductase [Candidatus Magasanikbacteria bacterium]|nr:FAD-dependent oxidoreductase [Candidatus Magasanikbacteria bacterium]
MKRPSVAIIGAGIFGVSCALELASKTDLRIFLFEQHDDIMREGTFLNQYRHHFGYHYPRSDETVQQCIAADADFRSLWGDAIIEGFPAYYAIAKEGSKVSPEDFLNFCERHSLPYREEYPDLSLLNPDAVSICVRTPEPIYDYARLKRIAKETLNETSEIQVNLGSRVVGGRIPEQSQAKILDIERGSSIESLEFDYVVNAMYGNNNLFYRWFGFGEREIEYRLKEFLLVKLPIKERTAVTVMDGPFVTLVATAEPGIFTWGDVPRSIHETKISKEGIPWTSEEIRTPKSCFTEMKIHDPYFIPITARAELIKSMRAVLAIEPQTEKTDQRLTAITNHGRGCWSVFEGKIITAVSTARALVKEIISG